MDALFINKNGIRDASSTADIFIYFGTLGKSLGIAGCFGFPQHEGKPRHFEEDGDGWKMMMDYKEENCS